MEIGSEFSTNSSIGGKNEYFKITDCPMRFVMSGRAGLTLIAREISTEISSIMMPDYCCGSMVAPFVKQGFDISFYNAFDLYNVDTSGNDKAILIMNYFGFMSDDVLKFVLRCKTEGLTVIVDATQTAFSKNPIYDLADYILISYRKWFDCLCATVYSKKGFTVNNMRIENRNYTNTWRSAAILKEKYLNSSLGDKQEFLKLFKKANELLDEDYTDYAAEVSEIEKLRNVDSEKLRNMRKMNAEYLIKEVKRLSDFYGVNLMFDAVKDEDCPLFVPILVENRRRISIRNELIKNNVYCPVHWPIDQRYPYKETSFHKKELSLICDQRYGLEEMKRQILILSEALRA